jgi:hypothetical protein
LVLVLNGVEQGSFFLAEELREAGLIEDVGAFAA